MVIVELNAKQAYAHKNKPEAKKPTLRENHFDRAPKDKVSLFTNQAQPSAEIHSIDKVNLSVGMSVEDVNKLLVSEVGKKVKAMFEEAGIDPASLADTDWSPEATAERIFRGTTGMFGIWKSQHKKMSDDELIDSFEAVLRKSVDQGASEAIGLIEARGFDKEESIVGTARETISLVHEKFDDYFETLRNGSSEEIEAEEKSDQNSY